MEQQVAQDASGGIAQFGSAAGLIGLTTVATHIFKSIVKSWPVPPVAFVFGELVTFAAWRTGMLEIKGLAPIGATPWEWIITGMWGLTVVLGAMGASTMIDSPKATVRRGTGVK